MTWYLEVMIYTTNKPYILGAVMPQTSQIFFNENRIANEVKAIVLRVKA